MIKVEEIVSQTKRRLRKIGLHGCDDATIFEMKLTDSEVATLKKVSAKSKKISWYTCMPTMTVEDVDK